LCGSDYFLQKTEVMERSFTDMIGHQLSIDYPPERIVSLVPSQTELLHDLGLEDQVVGITKFCVHPEQWFRSKTRIGGTKNVHIDQVLALRPQLVIANKEENERAQIEALQAHVPVWTSDIKSIADARRMIRTVGMITDRVEQASLLDIEIQRGFASLEKTKPMKVLYFIWRDPWMCAGGDTFISQMIEAVGWKNVLEGRARYPEIPPGEWESLKPDLIILSSEPYPFKEKHIDELRDALPGTKVTLADGEMFSWYGSRMIKAIPYLQQLSMSL
jgi:ABC-type Fe3+-hydroxamate transport system substrate-binding protein